MEMKELWYKLVAKRLLEERDKYYEYYQEILQSYCQMSNEFCSYKRVSKIETEKLRGQINQMRTELHQLRHDNDQLRGENPIHRPIVSTSMHASSQRIRDLESQLKRNGIEPQ